MNRPLSMPYMVPGETYYGETGKWRHQIEPEEIALYVHCRCGMTFAEFVAWLAGEIALLEAIDPDCSK